MAGRYQLPVSTPRDDGQGSDGSINLVGICGEGGAHARAAAQVILRPKSGVIPVAVTNCTFFKNGNAQFVTGGIISGAREGDRARD